MKEDSAADLTNIWTLLGKVNDSINTVSNSSNKVAAVSAVDFFNNALGFFYSLSSLGGSDVNISSVFNGSVRESAEKIISDSKAGVSQPSGEFKLVYHTISQSVKIIRMFLKLRIDFLLCTSALPTNQVNTCYTNQILMSGPHIVCPTPSANQSSLASQTK